MASIASWFSGPDASPCTLTPLVSGLARAEDVGGISILGLPHAVTITTAAHAAVIRLSMGKQ